MKRATIWGGFLGFLLALAAGLRIGREPVMLLLDACVGAAVCGWFFQWWQKLFLRNLHQAFVEQQANVPGEETSRETEGKETPNV